MTLLTNIVLLNTLMQTLNCYYIVKMNDEFQLEKDNLVINDDDYSYFQDQAFAYGIWSRYAPLSQITQIGKIGLFDSTCFHYHNVADKVTKNINFIYFDCLDYQNKKITKYVKFIDDSNQEHIFEQDIDINQYEYHWYYFQIIQWPQVKKFRLSILQYPNVILKQELQIKYPYVDKNLILKFGGGLQGLYDSTLLEFSYFPGKMILYPLDKSRISPTLVMESLAIYYFQYQVNCNCQMNPQYQITESKQFKKTDFLNFKSTYPNCNYFQLTGWLRFTEIIQFDSTFIYQLLKMTSATQNSLLKNENLSPFRLYYHIGESENKIIFTTYSYTFPSVSIDFSSNPYLITTEFKINNNIYLWHYFQVVLLDSALLVEINFYEGSISYQHKYTFTVNHFHVMNFNIQLGNLNGRLDNYINFEASQVIFMNCNFFQFVQSCNYKCQTCDGPTEFDCMSCPSDRIYLPHKKACVCPYNSYDNSNQCITLANVNLLPFNSNKQVFPCKYGEFIAGEKCIACPSIISQQQISCTECLINPQTWQNMLYCKTFLISQNGETLKKELISQNVYFTFDGEDIKLCESCSSTCLNDNCLIQDFSSDKRQQVFFCSAKEDENCQICNLPYCVYCQIKDNKMGCEVCDSFSSLIDGVCISDETGYEQTCPDNCAYCTSQFCYSCQPPYYITSDKSECKVCPIKNCLYCFVYQVDDPTQSTLYKDFVAFQADENTKIGCSKCNEGYNYDFTIGQCIFRDSTIMNCSNYYLDYSGDEVCLLSAIDDFSISPQISNCQNYISYCFQCLMTDSQVIKCIICQDGYTASVSTGQCQPTTKKNALVCSQGDFHLQDGWVQLIQSFSIQFLPDNYFYPKPTITYLITDFPIKCINGYLPNNNMICAKYCDSACLQCEADLDYNTYFCLQCPSNYYDEPNLSVNQGTCLSCPALCLACQPRSTDQISVNNSYIQLINPYFISTTDNQAYTYVCLRVIEDSKVFLDPEIQVASYCLNDECTQSLEYTLILTCDNIQTALSPTVFPYYYYEKQIDTSFCNQMGIKYISIKFLYQADPFKYQCVFNWDTMITNSLKQAIFSLQYIQFLMQGNKLHTNVFGHELNVNNFDQVSFQDMNFYLTPQSYLRINNHDQPVDLIINNTLFYGTNPGSISYSINVTLNRDVQLVNITLQNLWLSDTTFFQYYSNLDESDIQIYQIYLINCTLENTILFSFIQYSKSVKIQNLVISKSTFINSTIIKFNYSNQCNSYLDSIYLISNTIQSSTLFQFIGSEAITFYNLKISDSSFFNSVVIQSEINASLELISISSNSFIFSTFFRSTTQSSQLNTIVFTFYDTQFNYNKFTDSNLFYIHQERQQNQVSIYFNKSKNQFITNSDKNSNSMTFLYDIQCEYMSAYDFQIEDSENLPIFRIYYTNTAIFNDILYKVSQQSFKVSSLSSCIQDSHHYPVLLHVQGFVNITLNNINLMNQFSIDYSLIHILSDILYTPKDKETLQFYNIKFYGNLLLKNNLGNIFSLLVIYSDRLQEIKMYNISFEENFFNQQFDDPSLSAASLMFINSQQSSVYIDKLTCISNGLTNSSYTFITINSLSSSFNDFHVKNSNYLQNQIWLKYYQINADASMENYLFNQVIQQLFKIQNKGGIGQFAASTIIVTNSDFNQLIAQTNSVFSLTTQGDGIIKLSDVTIANASALLSQTIEIDGSISIYSKSSLLHLTVQNVHMESVKNRLGTALLSIYPSQKVNIINLQNITAFNCISLMNQFLTAQFSQESSQNNFVYMQGLNITFTEAGWNQYLQEITFPSQSELKKIMSDNAIININDCKFTLDKFYITGILISPIFMLTDIYKLTFNNIQIINGKVLYPFRMIQLIQTKSVQHRIVIYNLNILKTAQIYQSIFDQQTQIYSVNQINANCILTNISMISQATNQTINFLIKQLNENNAQTGSLIYITGISGLSKLSIKQINLFSNNCTFCYEGILYLSLSSFTKVSIDGIFCYQNQIYQYGCISMVAEKSSNNSKNFVAQKLSFYIKNNGTKGVGFHTSGQDFIISKSLFLGNIGSQMGGAIYAQDVSNNFILLNTIVTENSAEQGGGIYFLGQNYLTSQNFIQSINILNTAKTYSNNLVEFPDHLALSINNQEMISKQFKEADQAYDQLYLTPYECIEQGKKITSNYLMLPSSQQVSKYQLLNPKKTIKEPYITEFSLLYKNSMNEILEGQSNGICQVQGKNYSLVNGTTQGNSTNITAINFNAQTNSFDLSSLIISFDPYTQEDHILQLKFVCNSQSSNDVLQYQMNINTLKCQLGEFYVSGGCQICEPSYGFYSVQYDATKCSIFDKTKFQNITSNQIQLLNGKWRPYHQSDLIEDCFKNIKWCIGGWGVGNDLCYIGHIGGLCEECDIYNIQGNGYYQKNNSLACILCNNSAETLLPFIFITLWSLIATLLTLKSIKNTNKVFAILKTRTKLFEIVFKLTQDFESILLKMLLNYLWIFSVIFTFNISFAFSFSFVDQASNPSFFMATNLDCQLSRVSSVQLVYIRIITMILFMMIQIVVISTGFLLFTHFNKLKFDYGIVSNTVLYLFISNLAALIKNFGSLIAVRQISNIDYIQGNVALKFYEQEHIKWMLAFILPGLIIFGILIPFTLFLILFLSKKRFNQSIFRKYFGYLFNEYNKETYYWEQIKIWKKLILIILMTLFETSIYVKAALISLTLLCYQLLAVNNKPYIINSLNKLDVESGQIVSIAIFLAIVKYVSEQDNNNQVSTLLQVIIFLLCLRLFYQFLLNILRVYIKKYKLFFLSSCQILSQKIKSDSFMTHFFYKQLTEHKLKSQQLSQNYEKLRQCLLTVSKMQLEHQKKIISLANPMHSSRHSRLYSEMETNRMMTINKTILLTKEEK